METAKRLQDTRRHATVECIPVPPKVASKAPLYFKKSIDDAEDEWAQHHAKRWIDTSAKVRASVWLCAFTDCKLCLQPKRSRLFTASPGHLP